MEPAGRAVEQVLTQERGPSRAVVALECLAGVGQGEPLLIASLPCRKAQGCGRSELKNLAPRGARGHAGPPRVARHWTSRGVRIT